MKIPRKKTARKKLLGTAGIAAAAIVGVVAYWYFTRPQVANTAKETTSAPTNTVNYSPATEEEKADSAAAKQDALNGGADKPQTAGTLSVTISRASQVGDSVSVRSIVTGTVNGSCDFTFTKAGQSTVTKNIGITQGPTAATCNGDIPVGQFPSSGDWALSVVAKNNSASSPAATVTVSVTK